MSESKNLERDIEKISEILEKNIPEEIILHLYPAELVEQVKAGTAVEEPEEEETSAFDYRIIEEVYVRKALDNHFFIEAPESGKHPGNAGLEGVWMGRYDSEKRIFLPGYDLDKFAMAGEQLLENAKKVAEPYETLSLDASGALQVESPYPEIYFQEFEEGRVAVDQCLIGPELTAELYVENGCHALWLTRGSEKICRGAYQNNKVQPKITKMLTIDFIGATIEKSLLKDGETLECIEGKFLIRK